SRFVGGGLKMSKHITDRGSQKPPRLALGHSWWALSALPEPPESYLPRLKPSGFESIEVGLHPEGLELIKKCRMEHGLKVIGQGWANDLERAKPFIDRAAGAGVWALNMHLGHAYLNAQQAAALSNDVRERANDAGVLLLVETHRGRMTQDLYRTA